MVRRACPTLVVFVAACAFEPSGGADDVGGTCEVACGADGKQLTTCVDDVPVVETCALGCAAAPAPHCRGFSPSNGVTATDLDGVTATLAVPPDRVFVLDTDDGSIDSFDTNNPGTTPIVVRAAGDGVDAGISFRRANQANAAIGLGVWGFAGVTVAAGADLAHHGTLRFAGARAAVVLARGAIVIDGAIDAGAGRDGSTTTCRDCGGVGAGHGATKLAAATGCAPGGNGTYDFDNDETGGAGGGMSTPGSNGGDAGSPGGVSVPVTACPGESLEPLVGGSGGGRGGHDTVEPPPTDAGGVSGGGGGGAVQLTSLTSLAIAGVADLYAGGAGGTGSEDNYGGGGGAAGGAFLLEAPSVTVSDTATITANGGGGGAGRTANPGVDGRRDRQRANGGAGDSPQGSVGRGGDGGVSTDLTVAAGLSTDGNGSTDGTGGGGASAGRVRINTDVATPPVVPSGAVVSPAPSIGTRPVE